MITRSEDKKGVAGFVSMVVDLLYLPIFRSFVPRSLFRYLFCGVGNYIVLDALLYYVVYHYVVCERYVSLFEVVVSPHVAALIVVFPITFFVGFWLNRNVAFDASTPPVAPQLVRYVVSVGGSILLSYVTLKLFVEYLGIWATPAKVLSSLTTAVYSYLMAKFFTFKDRI